jgi:para-nitrobenzyl esterase
MSVNAMLTSPMAQGLFHRAIIMSGGNGKTDGEEGRKKAAQASAAFASGKGIAPDDLHALEKLRALPPEEVVDGLNLATMIGLAPLAHPFSAPFVDGKLTVDPAAAYASGRFAHVPIMIGATSNDIGGPNGFMIAGARDLAGVISASGVPTYEYRFSYVATSLYKSGADHASDIPFFFDTQDIKYGSATTARDNAMGETISDYIVNFAKTGDPNGGALPSWPRYSRAADMIMNFAEDGKAIAERDPLSVSR